MEGADGCHDAGLLYQINSRIRIPFCGESGNVTPWPPRKIKPNDRSTIAAGTNSTTIDILPIEDAQVENSETVILTLIDGTDYDLGTTIEGTVTIANNDTAQSWNLDIDGDGTIGALHLQELRVLAFSMSNLVE
ncbi:MAG: hypothetical protein ACO31I_10250 [Prochlorotrichaceae cyanobacterium]